MGGPVLRGSFHVTSRLQPESFVGATLGAAGFIGGSSISVTAIVTATKALPPSLSAALTLTLYSHLLPSGLHSGSS